jgi:hypothetical protein
VKLGELIAELQAVQVDCGPDVEVYVYADHGQNDEEVSSVGFSYAVGGIRIYGW